MEMDDRLQRDWRHHVATHPFWPKLALLDDGLLLGAGKVLAPTVAKAGGHAGIDLDRDGDRVVALLAVVHHGHLSPDLTTHLKAAVAAWERGDRALANIRLGLARLPALACEHDGYRLFLGERAFAEGMAPAGLMHALSLAGTALTLLKYPRQPHVPAGNGRASGQFDFSAQETGGTPPRSQQFAETCSAYIASNCLGSIHREFPSQFLEMDVQDLLRSAQSGDVAARKAKKLLFDKRFQKP